MEMRRERKDLLIAQVTLQRFSGVSGTRSHACDEIIFSEFLINITRRVSYLGYQ